MLFTCFQRTVVQGAVRCEAYLSCVRKGTSGVEIYVRAGNYESEAATIREFRTFLSRCDCMRLLNSGCLQTKGIGDS